MRKNILSFADRFAICNEAGEEVYGVKGELLSIGHKLSFQDINGNELLYISQRPLSWPPMYDITNAEQHVATVAKEFFTFFSCAFDISLDNHPDMLAKGDLSDHEYTITCGDKSAAQISKQWFSFQDTYGVEIEDGQDPVFLLACTVVIDMCCHEK